jgi:hypothetical protein
MIERCCVSEGACLCSEVWILVVHSDFHGFDEFERHGNDADVRNLRRVFQEQRKCRFAELANCGSDKIIGTLACPKQIFKIFHPDDECKYIWDDDG